MTNSISNEIKINNYNHINSAISNPLFKGNTDKLVRSPEQDSVELSAKEKPKKSKFKRFLIATGIGVSALAATAILWARHKATKLTKLYKEKLVLSHLPEKIEFKSARTLEDAIKFSKEVLGIKDVDKNFTLEALNWANEGLVNVSNAYKGNLFMPQKIHYTDIGENTYAGVVRNINLRMFADLAINPKFFDSKFLDKEIINLYGLEKSAKKIANKQESNRIELFINKTDEKLLDKFIRNHDSITIMEKRQLRQNAVNCIQRATELEEKCPIELIRILDEKLVAKGKSPENIDKLFSELSLKELQDKAQNMLCEYNKVYGKNLEIFTSQINPFGTIHHEMGHLQDYAINLEKLDVSQWTFGFKSTWNQIREAQARGEKFKDRAGVQELDNRWGTRKNFEKLMKKDPEKFKKQYPDMYEFLNDEKKQQIAAEVSTYAQSGIGEFVAEVHAGLIDGRKFSKRVIDLYKKYNGPMPANLL